MLEVPGSLKLNVKDPLGNQDIDGIILLPCILDEV